jgi:thiol-disulfide isomerase/thioredoxin
MEKAESKNAGNRRSGADRRKNQDPDFIGLDARVGKDRRAKEKHAIFIRCYNCLIVNRVSPERLSRNPVCGSCKTVLEFPREPIWAKLESFDRSIAYWPETLLVVFTAPVCIYSKIVDPILHDLARENAGGLKIMKADIESEQVLAERFKITKTPTFIMYKAGVEVLRVDGAPKDKTDLVTWIENLINYTSY